MKSRSRNTHGNSSGGKWKVLKITSRSIAVRSEPGKYAPILCQLQENVFVHTTEEKSVDGVLWLLISCGWICSLDSNGSQCYEIASDFEANRSWAEEEENCRRISHAIASMLTRSHSLVNARRVARSILKHTQNGNRKSLINLPDVSIEDLLIGLSSAQNLRQIEVFEFIKIASSQQSNPIRALTRISEDIHEILNQRPSLWVKNDLNVLQTYDVKERNDNFVMLAARGDLDGLEKCLSDGQELTATHSQLQYTALHAAAEFGQKDVIICLLNTGISVNTRDAFRGQTALHYCAQAGRTEIALLLLERGADRNLTNYEGQLPYQVADEQGHYQCREVMKFPPPEIQAVQVTKCTPRSITLSWSPPILHESIHAKVIEYMIEWVPVGDELHGCQFITSDTSFSVMNLRPSTGHGFLLRSRSLAGWSQPTSKLIHFTMASVPDPPPPVEVLKVTSNGMLIHWHPTPFENGGVVDFYQIELIDEGSLAGIYKVNPQEGLASAGIRGVQILKSNDRKDSDGSLISQSPDDLFLSSPLSLKKPAESNEDDSIGSLESFDRNLSSVSNQGDLSPIPGPDILLIEDDQNSLVGSQASQSSQENGSIRTPSVGADGTQNLSHRIYKQRNLVDREKQIMGLLPKFSYVLRVRCHNELGYSKWSSWTGPLSPRPGIKVLDFNPQLSAVTLEWFIPLLSKGRKVQCFELQLCKLKGSFFRFVELEKKNSNKFQIMDFESVQNSNPSKNKAEDTILEFITILDTITSNIFRLEDLHPGGRYLCRVRPKIDDEWSSWETKALLSEIIIIPATQPNPPRNIRPAMRFEEESDEHDKEYQDENDKENRNMNQDSTNTSHQKTSNPNNINSSISSGIVNHMDKEIAIGTVLTNKNDKSAESDYNPSGMELASDETIFTSMSAAVGLPNNKGKSSLHQQSMKNGDLEIFHDSMVLCWINGQSNGSPVIEYEIQGCKIRDYRISDISLAIEAHEGSGLQAKSKPISSLEESTMDLPGGTIRTLLSSLAEKENWREEDQERIESLGWINLTSSGEFMGPTAFRIRDLIPGASYIFRIRQRNAVGWSDFSLASPILTTYPTIPPSQPWIYEVGSSYAVLQWDQGGEDNNGLTNLDFEIQVSQDHRSFGDQTESETMNSTMDDWTGWHWTSSVSRMIPDIVEFSRNRQKMEELKLSSTVESCSRSSSGNFKPSITSSTRIVSAVVEDLTPGLSYVGRVRVRTLAGWSTWSSISTSFRCQSVG